MSALAIFITWALHPGPGFAAWTGGMGWPLQIGAALGFAAVAAAASLIVLAIPRLRSRVPTPEILRRVNLQGARPVAIGMCAGLGEETLFRAALQPVLGLWLTSAVFALAHMRTATLGTPHRWKQVTYMVNVFLAGMALGLVYEHVGLLAAILIHATIDIASFAVASRILRTASSSP